MKNIYSNIFSYSKKTLHKAITNLKKGEIVGLPTETVYGLAGNAYSKESITKIYKLEGKDADLANSINDYQRLIQLNKHIDSLFRKKVKEISSLAKKINKNDKK